MPINDATSGYKCIKSNVVREIDMNKVISQGYSFQIEVNESGFIPVKISVKPGTNVTWSNSGTKRAKIVSGPPPKMPGDHAHEEDDEIILGSLEIYPR